MLSNSIIFFGGVVTGAAITWYWFLATDIKRVKEMQDEMGQHVAELAKAKEAYESGLRSLPVDGKAYRREP